MENQAVILEKMITSLLNEKKYPSLRDILVTMNPSDIASVFGELEPDRIPLLFRLLPKEQAAETFVEMDPEAQELLIQGFSDSELKEVVDELYLDDAVDLVEEMPANVVRRILTQADPETRKSINELLRYPENSAGSMMTTEYVTLRPSMTVEESILRIRRTGVDKETIYTCYVTDNRTLLGLVTVKDLLLAEDDETPIRAIMQTHVISVSTLADQECSPNTTSWPFPWWTTKTAWWALSPLTTPWTLWRRRPPRTLRSWAACPPRKRLTAGPLPGTCSSSASPGCCC